MARMSQPLKKITARAQDLISGLLHDPEADRMNHFAAILNEFRELIAIYNNLFPEFIEQNRQKAVRTAYAQGGDCVHRGIHCPSPVLSLVVGCNAGVEIEDGEQATENYFKYSFDADDQLIVASHYDFHESRMIPDEMEFIFRRDHVEYGITFHNGWNEITRISKVVFREDGQPESYAASDYDEAEPELMFLHYEEYVYENDLPQRAEVYFGVSPELDMYEHHTFLVTMESTEADQSAPYSSKAASILREA